MWVILEVYSFSFLQLKVTFPLKPSRTPWVVSLGSHVLLSMKTIGMCVSFSLTDGQFLENKEIHFYAFPFA